MSKPCQSPCPRTVGILKARQRRERRRSRREIEGSCMSERIGRGVLEQLDALDDVILSISSELDLDAVLQRIVDLARRLVGARYCALGIVGPDGFLSDFITSGISQAERETIGDPPRGHGILGLLVREQRSLRMPDLSKHAQSIG